MKKLFLVLLLLGAGVVSPNARAEPHPETGLEYWAIPADIVPDSRVVIGRIGNVMDVWEGRDQRPMTRVDLLVLRALRGRPVGLLSIYEPTPRFEEFRTRRSVDGDFVVYAQPRTNGVGWLTYWTGYGVRSIETADQPWFAERLKEFEPIRGLKGQARAEAMLDWGLRCCERRITLWDGVNAIRNALHPGEGFRLQERGRRIATPERRARMEEVFNRLRDGWSKDWREASVLMEAFAYLCDDRLFHHEVRHYSSRLIEKPSGWRAHLTDFWRDYQSRSKTFKLQ